MLDLASELDVIEYKTTWSDGSNSRVLVFELSYMPASSAVLMLGKRYDHDTDIGTFTAIWDWALIRKYAATPPTLTLDNDETMVASVPQVPVGKVLLQRTRLLERRLRPRRRLLSRHVRRRRRERHRDGRGLRGRHLHRVRRRPTLRL